MYVLDCISSGDLPKKQNNTMAKEKDEDGKFDIFLVKKKFYSANAVDRASGKVSKAKVVEFQETVKQDSESDDKESDIEMDNFDTSQKERKKKMAMD